MKRAFKWAGWGLGSIVLWIAAILLAGLVASDRVPVTLSAAKFIQPLGDDYVQAEGTWVLEGDRQAYPLQTTQIRCERALMRCTAGTAMVMSGKSLSVDVNFYEVLSWKDGRIVFRDTSPMCASYIYTIDLASKSANGVRTHKPDGPAAQCSAITQELRMSLQAGWPVALKLQEDAVPWFGKLARLPFSLFG